MTDKAKSIVKSLQCSCGKRMTVYADAPFNLHAFECTCGRTVAALPSGELTARHIPPLGSSHAEVYFPNGNELGTWND